MPALKFMKTGGHSPPDRSHPILQSCMKLGGDGVVRRQRENTAGAYAGFYLPAHSLRCVSGCVYQIILALTFGCRQGLSSSLVGRVRQSWGRF